MVERSEIQVERLVRRINAEGRDRGKYYRVTKIDGKWADILWINQCVPMYQRMEIELIKYLKVVDESV